MSKPVDDGAEMLKRVRQALGRSATAAPTDVPVVPAEVARTVSSSADVLALFIQRATATGMNVRVLSSDELIPAVVRLLGEGGVRSVALGVGSLPEGLALGEALRRKKITVLDWRKSAEVDPLFEVDAGITDVHAAIAETGSLVCRADAGHSRGLSLIPPMHVALVRRSDILPDLMDGLALLGNRPGGSQTVLITGPSKTADIEGVLVTGVHGPGRVYVLVIADA